MAGALTLTALIDHAQSVALAVAPLAVFFLVFQLLFLKLPRTEVSRIVVGTLVAAAGLFLFLLGVSIGFLPYGRTLGEALGSTSHSWLVVSAGVLLGFVTTWSEPSVRILADQVEEASSGSIRRALVLATICVGAALSVGVGMLRIVYGIPLLYLLAPGYGILMVIMWFSDESFIGIAADAGGVATGPLANSFLLALAFGVSSAMGDRDPLVHGLGLVALIALAPVMSVMTLGLIVRRKTLVKEP